MRLAIALCGCLAGCAGFGEPQLPNVVRVPVAVSCVASVPERPRFATDEELLAADRYRRTLEIWLERRKALAYVAELEAVVSACATAGAPKVPGPESAR